MINYHLTGNQTMILDLVKKINEEQIKPMRKNWDEKDECPEDLLKLLGKSGLFSILIPEKYGGMGGKLMDLNIVAEELAKADAGIAASFLASYLGLIPILKYATEEQKEKYLPSIARGEKIVAFGVTESAAGSDVSSISTTAEKKDGYYVLNGTKQFITNGGIAEIYCIAAKTDKNKGARGISIFILDKGLNGFEFGKMENKLGIRASATRELIFNDCRVPGNMLLGGKENAGFIHVLRTFEESRLTVAAQAVGIAHGALELAINYSKERTQFGQKISNFQGIQWMLADMSAKVEAARSLVYAASKAYDDGQENIGCASAQAKMFASDVAMDTATNALQIFGGNGYIKDYPIEKYFRDAKITQIYEGTNQIQKNIIALDILKKF
jgi:alkylation response protein AidB-like acyl-CoA dehydrogenase